MAPSFPRPAPSSSGPRLVHKPAAVAPQARRGAGLGASEGRPRPRPPPAPGTSAPAGLAGRLGAAPDPRRPRSRPASTPTSSMGLLRDSRHPRRRGSVRWAPGPGVQGRWTAVGAGAGWRRAAPPFARDQGWAGGGAEALSASAAGVRAGGRCPWARIRRACRDPSQGPAFVTPALTPRRARESSGTARGDRCNRGPGDLGVGSASSGRASAEGRRGRRDGLRPAPRARGGRPAVLLPPRARPGPPGPRARDPWAPR